MSKMSPRDKTLLLIMGGLLILGGLWKFYLSPAKADRTAAEQRISDAEGQVTTLQAQLTQLQAAQKGPAASGKQPVRLVDKLRLAKAYPYDQDLAPTILQIEQIAKESKVTLGEATPDAGTDYAGVTGTSFKIDVEGRFFEVQDFMYRMHNRVTITPFGKLKVKGRLFAITQADLAPADGAATSGSTTSTTSGSTRVKASLTAVVFSHGAGTTTPTPTTPDNTQVSTTTTTTGGN